MTSKIQLSGSFTARLKHLFPGVHSEKNHRYSSAEAPEKIKTVVIAYRKRRKVHEQH